MTISHALIQESINSKFTLNNVSEKLFIQAIVL
jgi:hypothetical protein